MFRQTESAAASSSGVRPTSGCATGACEGPAAVDEGCVATLSFTVEEGWPDGTASQATPPAAARHRAATPTRSSVASLSEPVAASEHDGDRSIEVQFGAGGAQGLVEVDGHRFVSSGVSWARRAARAWCRVARTVPGAMPSQAAAAAVSRSSR